MMKLIWSKRALNDIQNIVDYYSSVGNENVARKVVRKIYAVAQPLEHNPRVGQRELSLEDHDRTEEFRRLVYGNYKIIYYIKDDKVSISAIWDCRRDPATLRESVVKTKT